MYISSVRPSRRVSSIVAVVVLRPFVRLVVRPVIVRPLSVRPVASVPSRPFRRLSRRRPPLTVRVSRRRPSSVCPSRRQSRRRRSSSVRPSHRPSEVLHKKAMSIRKYSVNWRQGPQQQTKISRSCGDDLVML